MTIFSPSITLFLALLVPIVLLGGVNEWGLLAALVLAIFHALLVIMRTRNEPSRSARWAFAGLLVSPVVSALQLIPLPRSLLASLAPKSAAAYTQMETLVGGATYARPISLDTPATWFALATGLTAVTIFWATASYARTSEQRGKIVEVVLYVISVFSALAVAHRLAEMDSVFGIYRSETAVVGKLPVQATLLNPNHAGALAGLGFPLGVGLYLEKERKVRALYLVLGVLCGVVSVLTLSRGAIVVMAVQSLALVAFVTLRKRKDVTDLARIGVAVLLVGGALAAVSWAAGREFLVQELQNTQTSKFDLFKKSYALGKSCLPLGCGRGAYEVVFPAFESGLPSGMRYTHAENWPIHLFVELGVFAIVLVGLLAGAAFRALPKLARPTNAAVGIALAGLIIHDLGDFSMEFVGVASPAAALLGVVVTAGETGSRPEVPINKRWALPGLMLLLCLASFMIFQQRGRSYDKLLSSSLTANEEELTELARRYPTEPQFAMMLGLRRVSRGDDTGPALILTSLNLGPNRHQGHLAMARLFGMSGRASQAWSEFVAAARLKPDLGPTLLREAQGLGMPAPELANLAPTERMGVDFAGVLAGQKKELLAAEMLFWLIERFAPALEARRALVDLHHAAGRMEDARREVDDLVRVAPESLISYVLRARTEPDFAKCDALLSSGLVRYPNDRELLEMLVRHRAKTLGFDGLSAQLEALQQELIREGRGYYLHIVKAEVFEQRKEYLAAIASYTRAADADDLGVPYLERAAKLAEGEGQRDIAELLMSRLVTSRPEVEAYKLNLERLRRASSTAAPVFVGDAGAGG